MVNLRKINIKWIHTSQCHTLYNIKHQNRVTLLWTEMNLNFCNNKYNVFKVIHKTNRDKQRLMIIGMSNLPETSKSTSVLYIWACKTSNVTGRHWGPKRKLQTAYTKSDVLFVLTDFIFFIVECDIGRFLCAMHVFEVQASSSSLGYLCATFRFFRGLHSWASWWRKIMYSITELIWCHVNRSFCFGIWGREFDNGV